MGKMKSSTKWLSFTLLAVFLFVSPLEAHEEGATPGKTPTEVFGTVHFATSCSPTVEKSFDRAVALLHSFWYVEAEKAFAEVAKADAGCAMAHWGVAMTYFHQLWAPPTPADLKNGLAAAEQAVSVGAKTERERDYIRAIGIFYQDSEKLDHKTRAKAYEKAMEQVYLRYADDKEAAIFYALALDATAPPADKTYAQQKKAGEILNKLAPLHPDHPGIAHYLIHSYDFPPLATLGLPAARSYAGIAESSPHALHMPSHIFTRLGLWEDTIRADLASGEAAKNYVDRVSPGNTSWERLHSLDYLVYAYLQGAQDGKAKALLDEVNGIKKVDWEALPSAYAMAAIPARHALERHRWTEAATLTLYPVDFPWQRFRSAEAITIFARAIGAARSGDVKSASADIERLAMFRDEVAAKDAYWSGQIEIQRRIASAWLAFGKGEKEEALKLMQSAAGMESATEKHPVTPGAVLPARELLADMLMELGRPAEALKEYEATLAVSPNRFNSLYGAAQAAAKSGDKEKARSMYGQLVSQCSRGDSERPELVQAKSFLASK
jgi:tetratricopeptide (TPR) repeat protein